KVSHLVEGFFEENLSLQTEAVEKEDKDYENGLEIVLTDVTGFLGQHLLSHLLAFKKVRRVHCIAVQPESDGLNNASSHPPGRHLKARKYSGDLTLPLLGLSPKGFQKLALSTDIIIHNGADTSFLKVYNSRKPANVLSTKTLAQLALLACQLQRGKNVPVHSISTASVAAFALKQHSQDVVFPVSLAPYPPCEPDAAVKDGYAASKWVGEVMLERLAWSPQLSGCGMEVVIHRPVSLYTVEGTAKALAGYLTQRTGKE
ncbi:male sterility protein-domain-containing protein, partial [Triangularia setosa]